MAIGKDELFRRLAFIKYLFSQASEAAEKGEPACNAAILTLHDAIELFLQLACEHLDVDSKKADFLDYFELINKKVAIAQTESMKRFNKTRVALKHHGTMTSKTDIGFFVNSGKGFFVDNSVNIFEIDFDTISLVDLVTYEGPKGLLLAAQKHIKEKDLTAAITEITIAFWQMIEEYEDTKRRHFGKSPFFFGNSMTFLSAFSIKPDDKKIEKFIDNVKESIESMQTAMKILSLGIDYRKFSRFDRLTPTYIRTMGGHQIQDFRKVEVTDQEANWCLDFAIESCVKLQNFDYNVEDNFA